MSDKAVVEKVGEKTVVEKNVVAKVSDKIIEKRRALGRGLDSLLPGPRVVPSAPAVAPGAGHPSTATATNSGTAPTSVPANNSGETANPAAATNSAGAANPAADSSVGVAAPAAGSAGDSGRDAIASGAVSGATIPPVVSGATAPAIVAELRAAAASGDEVISLPLDSIDNNPYQTRFNFNEEALRELADSIRTQGVIQPILVRPNPDGRYSLILGERRLRASRLAGMETIRAMVKRVSEQQAAEITLVENLQRQDLNCVEQAEAFQNLSQNFHLTQEEIGARVGVSRETVSNYLRLLVLPEGVIGALQKGKLTYSHARSLLQLRDNVQIWTLAKQVMEQNMSVAQLDGEVVRLQLHLGQRPKKKVQEDPVDPNVRAAQRQIEEILGIRVRIRDHGGRGKIILTYDNLNDYDRVIRMLRG
jgi:ParB family transcriptional regulator, chromosome partitioning protein